MPGPGPQRRSSPLGELGLRVGRIAGEAAGGGIVAEQRRIAQVAQRVGGSLPSGSTVSSDTNHTSETNWISDPLAIAAGRDRILVVIASATGVTPGVVGSVFVSAQRIATAPVDASGALTSFVAYPSAFLGGAGGIVTVRVTWPTPQSGTFGAGIVDLG